MRKFCFSATFCGIKIRHLKKMEPLKSTKSILTMLSLYPASADDSSSFEWKKLARIAMLPTILISCLSMDLACFTFIYKFLLTNLGDCLFTLLAAIVCMATLYTMIIAFRSRHQIASVVDQLMAIYDDRKCFERFFWTEFDFLIFFR